MTAPLKPTYREAQLAARAVAGSVSVDAAKALEKELKAYGARIAAQLAALPKGAAQAKALDASRQIILHSAYLLHSKLTAAIAEQRRVSFEDVSSVWETANGMALMAADDVAGALVGGVKLPGLTLAGAYENLGGAAHGWKTRLQGYVQDSAIEADAIVRTALLEGMGPEELAKRLRPYLSGAEEFYEAFGGEGAAAVRAKLANLQNLPAHLRGASRKLQSNARRIAYSEIWNARAEADLTAMARNPLVAAIKWTLSPWRGQLDGPDVCDALALNDFYGLGPGVYPLDAVPLPPHPYDRCERVPVLRPPEHAHLPKPKGKPQLTAAAAKVHADNVGYTPSQLTLAKATRIREQLAALLEASQSAPAAKAMGELMAKVETVATQALFSKPAPVITLAKEALAPAKAAAALPTTLTEDVLLGEKIAGPTGSNVAGDSGLWRGKDGVTRYVKQYKDPGQAYAEQLANKLYQKLGIAAPESWVIVTADGRTLYASRYLEGVKGTLGKVGLTANRANKVLDGFVADAFMANYDAVGTGLDNVVILATGQGIRIDQGGAFLWRAQGAKKKAADLLALPEWDRLSDASVNPYYAKVFQKAGLTNGNELGQRAIDQIDHILAVREGYPSWAAFIDETVPGLAKQDRLAISQMLETRTTLLKAKRAELAQAIALVVAPAEPIVVKEVATVLPVAEAPVIPATAAFPPPLGGTANLYVEQLVGHGTWTPAEVLAQVKTVYPKTIFTEEQVAKKFAKLGVKLPGSPAPLAQIVEEAAPLPAPPIAAPPPPPPPPVVAPPVVPPAPAPAPVVDVFAEQAKLKSLKFANYFTDSTLEQQVLAVPGKADELAALYQKAIKGDLAALESLKQLGGDTTLITKQWVKAYATPGKAAKLTAKSLEQHFGLTGLTDEQLAGMGQSTKKAFLQDAAKALAGDPEALAKLDAGWSYGTYYNPTKLPSLNLKGLADKGLAADKKAKKLTASLTKGLPKAADAPPLPGPPPIPSTPASALPYQIEPQALKGFVADSQVQEPLYATFNGTKAKMAIESGAIDLTKAADTTYGHAFVLKPGLSGASATGSTKEFAIKATKVLKGTEAELKAKLASLGLEGASPSEITAALRAQGYDAVVEVKAGKTVKVAVLDPSIVKLVKTAQPAYAAPVYGGPSAKYAGLPVAEAPPVLPPGAIRDATAYKRVNDLHEHTYSALTSTEKGAVNSYTGSAYRGWNDHLRGGGAPSDSHRALDRAIAKQAPLQETTVVYRGLGRQHPIVQDVMKNGGDNLSSWVGRGVVDDGFGSTSFEERVAMGFMDSSHGIVMEIRCPAGTRGYFANRIGSHRGEAEFILPRGHRVKILEVRREDGKFGHSGSSGPTIRLIAELVL